MLWAQSRKNRPHKTAESGVNCRLFSVFFRAVLNGCKSLAKDGTEPMKLRGFIDRLKYSEFFRLYNFRDEKSKGRVLVLMHGVLNGITTNLTTGVFYTSFLMLSGINIVDAGILTFVPYIAQLFYLFSPYILEHFPKRRWLLFGCRFLYHFLFILGVTLLPNLVSEPKLRLQCFVALVLAANIVQALGGQGYTVWHANFIPDGARATYFTFNSMITSFGANLVAVISAVAADRLSASPYADTIIIALRYVGFGISLLDMLVLALPKEYPYPKSAARPHLTDLFVLPFKHKKFLLTMVVCFLHTFIANIPAGVFNYFLLNTIGVRYSYIYAINILYSLFLLLFLPLWRGRINHRGWVKVFIESSWMNVPALLLYAFISPVNYVWLMGVVRLYQHFLGVGRDIAYTNFVYMNLPAEDQTNYLTFSALGNSLFTFLGMSLGTWFVAVMGDTTLFIFGFAMNCVPLLLIVQATGVALLCLFIRAIYQKILPECDKQLGL